MKTSHTKAIDKNIVLKGGIDMGLSNLLSYLQLSHLCGGRRRMNETVTFPTVSPSAKTPKPKHKARIVHTRRL
jgi:hypothetical protein